MPLPKIWFFKNAKNPIGTDSADLNQCFSNGPFTYFDRFSFQVQSETKKHPFTEMKLKTVYSSVFVYEPKNYDYNTGPEKSQSSWSDKQRTPTDIDSWSLTIEEMYVDLDDKLWKVILESSNTSLFAIWWFLWTNNEVSKNYCSLLWKKNSFSISQLWLFRTFA